MNIITTKNICETKCFDTEAILENIAEMLKTKIRSWGSKGDARLALMDSGLSVGAQEVINYHFVQTTERLLVISSTTPKPFDGIYRLNGEKVDEMKNYAFFGTQYNGPVPSQFLQDQ